MIVLPGSMVPDASSWQVFAWLLKCLGITAVVTSLLLLLSSTVLPGMLLNNFTAWSAGTCLTRFMQDPVVLERLHYVLLLRPNES
jgi:hypothetical protein